MSSSLKWPLIGIGVVFVGVIVLAVIVSRPTEEVDPNVDISETTNDDGETSLEVNDPNETNNEEETNVRYLDNFDPMAEPADEIQIIDMVEGDGQEVASGATVTAHYTGAYAISGEIFESSKDRNEPFTSPLSNLIPGWQEGIPGMREGGTRRLIIPGNLAYGEAPQGYTPGDGARPLGTLVFDIELISTEN